MKLKISQLTNFPTFFSKIKSQKLPFKISYKLSILALEIEKHVNFYQEQFRGLILEYSEKDKDGNPVSTEDGNGVKLAKETLNEAYAKLEELGSLEAEIPDTKFSLEDFDGVELTPEEIMVIMPFIEG